MREYEFRGKSVDEWVYGMLLKTEENDYGEHGDEHFDYLIQTEEDKEFERSQFYITDNSTIGQYTGMKDINGTKIYEGDIVAEEGHYVNSDRLVYQKIQWKDNYACWLRGEYQRLTPKNIERYKIIVIGNVIDNPKLLEEDK